MGIERIVQKIGRPEEVLLYRSGYLAQDRRNIEARIRDNSIRGVIATSALELGIDMPDLNYGVNLDLPPSRKAFHQRLGRVGRSKPGNFIILAPVTRFSTYGETLRDYYQNSVEPSHLYLDNDHINYQQARCLKDEMERCGLDSRKAPEPPSWPEGFQEVLRNAHGRPPVHLLNTVEERTDAPPQIAHGLRNAGEETLRILARQEEGSWEAIGFINIQSAMTEAYPGGIYRHRGTSYQVESWGREKNTRQPFIRTRKLKGTGRTTKPILRRTAVIPRDPTGIINRREMDHGHLSELRVVVTESVEGCENAEGKRVLYLNERARDPRMTRKQREMPTTAVLLQIGEPWFSGEAGEAWRARRQIAQALRMHLAYQQSIALPDLGCQVENIILETDRGFLELQDAILVHDNIHGGMGLVQDLYQNIDRYVRNLNVDTNNEPGTVYLEYALELAQWLERDPQSAGETPPTPGPGNWWRVIRSDTEVRVFSQDRDQMVLGKVEGQEWRDGVVYLVRTEGETIEARDSQLAAGQTALDWQLWQPETGKVQELQLIM